SASPQSTRGLRAEGALLPVGSGLCPGCDACAKLVGEAGGALTTSAPPASSTGTGAGGGDGGFSKAESQDSSSSTFWCAAFQKARISSSSRPAAKAEARTARVM